MKTTHDFQERVLIINNHKKSVPEMILFNVEPLRQYVVAHRTALEEFHCVKYIIFINIDNLLNILHVKNPFSKKLLWQTHHYFRKNLLKSRKTTE